MKIYILSLLCLLGFYGKSQITYGAKAGVNVSKISNVHFGSEKRVGFYAGGFATIPLNDHSFMYYIQPELLYSQMGEKEEGSEDVNIDYIAMPIFFKVYFSENDSEAFAEIGPQISFLISEDLSNSGLYGKDTELDYTSIDYGLNIGLGFSYIRKWEVSARFYYGLADILKGDLAEYIDGQTVYDDPKNVNSYVNFGIAYRF